MPRLPFQHGTAEAAPYAPPPETVVPSAQRSGQDARHLAWVWQFESDGDPAKIRDMLAVNGLGIVVKTHDATNWMSRYSKTGANGPAGVQGMATYFEQAGVPFHAWTVVRGVDPLREAQMAADVLGAGARSLFLDLESHDGFWEGTSLSAMRFGTELRRLRPSSWVSTSVDARPWELPRIPLTEFASFTDEIAPQTYWNLFKSPANIKLYTKSGDRVPAGGVTAAFVVESAMRRLRQYGRPLHPIGDGTPGTLSAWGEFINQSYGEEAETLSVWRYGVADPAIWRMLKNTPPRSASYLVQGGDTLSGIAAQLNTTVPALLATNTTLVHNTVTAGMRLRVPAALAATPGVAAPVKADAKAPRLKRAAATQFEVVPSMSSKVQALTRAR